MKKVFLTIFLIFLFSISFGQEIHLFDVDGKGNYFNGFLSKPYTDWKVDFLAIHRIDSLYHITYGVREKGDTLQRIFTSYYKMEINNDSSGYHFITNSKYILHTISVSGVMLYGEETVIIMIQEIARNGAGYNVFVEMPYSEFKKIIKKHNEK